MTLSAKRLGERCGFTAEEMNILLKEEGFLSGEPGNYYPTEKGKLFVVEKAMTTGTVVMHFEVGIGSNGMKEFLKNLTLQWRTSVIYERKHLKSVVDAGQRKLLNRRHIGRKSIAEKNSLRRIYLMN